MITFMAGLASDMNNSIDYLLAKNPLDADRANAGAFEKPYTGHRPTTIPEGYDVQGKIWFRVSTNEWVMELNGSINDTAFIARHTAPEHMAPEDVVGLPHLYNQVAG